MKLLIEASCKGTNYNSDGIILPLEGFAVESVVYYSLDEIREISKSSRKEVFVKINKNLFNRDIPIIKDILIELDRLNITGIFFYDQAVLQLKRELKLDINLVWSATSMVNNYVTCNYYYEKGVKYALLSKEITLDEIIDIIHSSKVICMVEVVSLPSVAVARRRLITNYYKDIDKDKTNNIIIKERVSHKEFNLIEDNNGTTFFLNTITNGTGVIKRLYDEGCKYIIMREYKIDNFSELVDDTMDYIKGKCFDDNYILKYKRLGDDTNFFFKETIYKVKRK